MSKLHGRAFKKLKLLIIISFTFLICITDTNQAVSQSNSNTNFSNEIKYVLEKLDHKIKIGVRTAAYPIGRDVKPTSAEGFCGVFGRELKKELSRYDKSIEVRYDDIENEYNKTWYDRFDGLRNGKINIECGPNSKDIQIDNVADDIQFSVPFYETGIKLLLKKSIIEKIHKSSDSNAIIKSLKIATVRDTTTYNQLSFRNKLKYGIELIDPPFETRKKALEYVLNSIDDNVAYASDMPILASIIKRGIRNRINPMPKELFDDYGIFPQEKEKYITQEKTEAYVIAIKDDSFLDPLLDTINWILNEKDNPLQRLKVSKQEIKDFEIIHIRDIDIFSSPKPNIIPDESTTSSQDIDIPKDKIFWELPSMITIITYINIIGLTILAFNTHSKKDNKTMKSNQYGHTLTSRDGSSYIIGQVVGDINNTHSYSQDSEKIIQEINLLLDKISQKNPEDSDRVIGAKALDEVEKNPKLRSRIIRGIKVATFASLEEAINHPAAKFFLEGIKEIVNS